MNDIARRQQLATSKIGRLQIAALTMPQFNDFKTWHYYAEGMYGRAVWRPAGVMVVGRLHKKSHFSVLLSGTLRIYTEDGEGWKDYEAPSVFTTPAGSKRATLALTDAIFMTIHRLDPDTRDAEEIERQLVDAENDLPSLFDFENNLKDPSLAAPARAKELESD